ncbi:MAG TPA: alpha/beta fold hydrolase [Pseudonocardiaceae bacterium]
MPVVTANGVRLSYTDEGAGEPVLLISPAAARATVWAAHQVPALRAAGYRVITYDHRGSGASDAPPGPYRVPELVADAAALIRALGIGPCRVMGASLGAMVAQELALVRPDLVHSAVLLCTRGRTDLFRTVIAEVSARACREPGDPRQAAVNAMFTLFSPATLMDDATASDWLDVMTAFPQQGEGAAAQYEATRIADRLDALSGITRPVLVVAFSDDVLMPVPMVREVADAIPGSRFLEFGGCGHFGFLERPAEVNAAIVEFFARAHALFAAQ